MKVALGESRKMQGYFTVDLYGEPDLIHDINNGLPFPDNSVDEIRAIHVVITATICAILVVVTKNIMTKKLSLDHTGYVSIKHVI